MAFFLLLPNNSTQNFQRAFKYTTIFTETYGEGKRPEGELKCIKHLMYISCYDFHISPFSLCSSLGKFPSNLPVRSKCASPEPLSCLYQWTLGFVCKLPDLHWLLGSLQELHIPPRIPLDFMAYLTPRRWKALCLS